MKSIRVKLILIGLIAGLISLIQTAVNIYSVNQGTGALAFVYGKQVEPSSALQEMERTLQGISSRMAGVLFDQMTALGSKNHLKEARESIPRQWALFREKTRDNNVSKEAKEQIATIEKQIKLLPAFLNKLDEAYSNEDKKVLAGLLEEEWPAFQKGLVKPNSQLVTYQQAAVKETYEISHAQGKKLIFAGLGVLVVSLIILSIGIFLIIRSITRPLDEAVRIAERVAAGDLTQAIEVHSQDEIGKLLQAMKNMNESLVNIVGQVRGGTDTIATASNEIAAGNLDLSSRTEQQASTWKRPPARWKS